MNHWINGKQHEIPVATDGTVDEEAIRRAGNIPGGRQLVVQDRDGRNRVVNRGEQLKVAECGHFVDMPISTRGAA